MPFFPVALIAHPEFMPFQSLYVQVRPGCEECRFRVIALKQTQIIVSVFHKTYTGLDIIDDITGSESDIVGF